MASSVAASSQSAPDSQPTSAKSPARPIVYWADLIRVIAIYLVVIVHVSGQLTNAWGKVSEWQWLMADIYGSVARISVPLFFMMSGYLLLPRREGLRAFYTKRMPRIVVPFIAWSIIYISFACSGNPSMCTREYLLDFILLKRTYFHLWFLYSLTGIYLVLPVLRLMVRADTDKAFLWYPIVLWVIFQPVRTLMDYFLHFSLNINSQLSIGFLPYLLLGYLLGELTLTRRRLNLAAGLFVLGALVTVVGTYLLTRAVGHFAGYFYDYITIGVIPASAGTFLLLRRLSDLPALSTDRFHKFTRWLAGGSFGVYLVHVIILWALDWVHVNTFMGFALWTVPLIATLVFAIAFLITRLLQKTPVVNYLVPG